MHFIHFSFLANRFWVPVQPKSDEENCPSLKYDYGEDASASLEYKNCSSTFSVICKSKMTDLVTQIQPPFFSCKPPSMSKKKKRGANDMESLLRIPRDSPSKTIKLCPAGYIWS